MNHQLTTDDGRCPECDLPRTEILSRYCATCHEFEQSLGTDYLSWRDEQNAEVA